MRSNAPMFNHSPMKLPKNNHKLDEIFKSAPAPDIPEFHGEYFVDMLTILPSLRRFSHRKVFHSENGRILGYNMLFSNKKCGHFFLEEGICKEADSSKVIIINYNRPENSFLTSGVRDQVKCIEKGSLYLGRFNCLFMGKLRFLGYFSLTKIK